MEQIRLDGFCYRYSDTDSHSLKSINLNINRGEFIVLCGSSGSGKSTLLGCIKALPGAGEYDGEIFLFGEKSQKGEYNAEKIGFVSQLPDEQCVCDTVGAELAFAAESVGMDNSCMRSRIAQISLFFGLEQLMSRKISQLSGGQKQTVALASVMVAKPDIILLDEPLSQLSPIASAEFVALLSRINSELGVTVVIAEHHLNLLLSVCKRAILLDKGEILCDGTAAKLVSCLAKSAHSMLCEMPAGVRLSAAANNPSPLFDIPSARDWYSQYIEKEGAKPFDKDLPLESNDTVVELKNVFFRYERDGEDILKNLSLKIHGGITAIMGGNAAGKSTLLSIIAKTEKLQRGSIKINTEKELAGAVGYLPQNPALLFCHDTLYEELLSVSSDTKKTAELFGLSHLLSRNALDLSGGERQRAAIAKLYAKGADIFLLDEPTKGMDAARKQELSQLLSCLKSENKTVVIVSHDMDFCAENADKCMLLFDGAITVSLPAARFFEANEFFTTDSAKIACGKVEGVYKLPQLLQTAGYTPEKTDFKKYSDGKYNGGTKAAAEKKKRLPPLRKACLISGGITLAAVLLLSTGITPLKLPASPAFLPYILLCLPVILLIFGSAPSFKSFKGRQKRPPRISDITAAFVTLIAIPFTAVLGTMYINGERKLLIISVLILLECLAAFFISFEQKKPKAIEIAMIAALCAAAVAGRQIFFMLPQFKPVAAIAIISGAALGAQSGFMVGAVSMLASNMLFGQGMWTPWQMLAMGLVGFFAGVIFKNRGNLALMSVYAFISAIVLYGGIMNISSAFMYLPQISLESVAAYVMAGLPLDVIHACSSAAFLLIIGEPLICRCIRIRSKFGVFS